MLRHNSAPWRRRLGALAAGTLLAGSTLTAYAQTATQGESRPRGEVTTDRDPLRARSAEENVSFGVLLDSDEKRLTLREGVGESPADVTYDYGPKTEVIYRGKRVKLTDLPARVRLQVYRADAESRAATRIVAIDTEDETPRTTTDESDNDAVGLGLILDETSKGLVVAGVRPDGPADKAGVRAGDEIVALNDNMLGSSAELQAATARMEQGAAVTIRVRRGDTVEEFNAFADVGAAARDGISREKEPAPSKETVVIEDSDAPQVHATVEKEVELGATFETTTEGVAVVRIETNSPLAKAGLEEGDMIKQVAGQNVLTPRGIFDILNEHDGGDTVEIVVDRKGEELTYTLELPPDHKRVLVETEGSITTSEPNMRGRGVDRMSEEQMREWIAVLARANALQQQQIQWLASELQAVESAAGFAGSGTDFPVTLDATTGLPLGIGLTGTTGTIDPTTGLPPLDPTGGASPITGPPGTTPITDQTPIPEPPTTTRNPPTRREPVGTEVNVDNPNPDPLPTAIPPTPGNPNPGNSVNPPRRQGNRGRTNRQPTPVPNPDPDPQPEPQPQPRPQPQPIPVPNPDPQPQPAPQGSGAAPRGR